MKPTVLALLGPTASGKTAAALELATRFPLEIISVDSALVYRGMDVGTAKPSEVERAAVPHHLIDLIQPTQSYSAMDFRRDALEKIDAILERGHWPLLVGGTMLYYKALAEGLDALPPADSGIRAELEREISEAGVPALHARLTKLDPETGARLNPNDAQRVQRAMEIILITGRPMSSLLSMRTPPELPFSLLPIALEPSDRSVLHTRIATRFDTMLAAPDDGLIGEVRRLRQEHALHPGLPSMRCVGYRQAWEYLDGTIDYSALREQGIAATRQLAKRQLTWLRSMPHRRSVDCNQPGVIGEILQIAETVWIEAGPVPAGSGQ